MTRLPSFFLSLRSLPPGSSPLLIDLLVAVDCLLVLIRMVPEPAIALRIERQLDGAFRGRDPAEK